MSAVFEAHLRMMSTLPIRTHAQRDPIYTPHPTLERRERIRQLMAEGVKYRHIPEILGISRTAVQKHIRAIKRGK